MAPLRKRAGNSDRTRSMDFLQYILQEVKSRRLAQSDALEVVRQYAEGGGAAAPE